MRDTDNPASRSRRLPRLVGVVAGLAVAWSTVPPPSSAQVPPPDSIRADTVLQLQGLVAAVPIRTSIVGGTSALVVTLDSLRLPPVPTFEEAFRAMPFVHVRQNSRGMAEISVRGSESRQVAVLVDGVPLTLTWDHRTDPAVIPLLGAQRVDFVRGLSTLLQGPNALGGVVEIEVAGRASPIATETAARVSAGIDDEGAESIGATFTRPISLSSGSLVVRAGAGYRARDGVALPGDVDDLASDNGLRTNSDTREVNGFASLRWEGEEGRWASFSTSAFQAERGVPPELHVSEPRLWRYPDDWRVVTSLLGGTGQRSTPWGTGDLEASIGLNLGSQEIDSYATAAYDEIVGREVGEDRTLTLRLLGDHTLGARGELRTALTFADVAFDLTEGDDPTQEFHQRLWSIASEIAWRLPRDLRVSGGIAIDGSDTPEAGGREPLGALWAVGGRIGSSLLLPERNLILHASASTRARFPALRELYSGALGRFEPNPDLEPERLFALETGVTVTRSRFEVEGVVFHHRLTDAVVRTTLPDGKFKRINRDEILSTGLELLANVQLADTRLRADLTLQDVSVEDPGTPASESRPEHLPEVEGGMEIDLPLPLEVRGIGAVRYLGDQFCVHPDLGTTVDLEGSTRVDLGLERSWRLPGSGLFRTLKGIVSLDNLTDEPIYDQCGMPQVGRTLRVGVELL